MAELLPTHPLTHGGLFPYAHPVLGTEVVGESAIRYLRFRRPVMLDRLELAPHVYGRWVPSVPVHPAHLLISVMSPDGDWQTVREVDLPYDPRIAGEGLSQAMTQEEMDAHFAAVLRDPPHIIPLDGLETDHLRVICDREHPHWPNHGEVGGGPHCVPFGILNTLQAYGDFAGSLPTPIYQPLLRVGRVAPVAPTGMTVVDQPTMLLFRGEQLSVGFSLRRPMLMHLGWDAQGGGQAMVNRLTVSRQGGPGAQDPHYTLSGFCGPVLRTLGGDIGPCHWTGEVTVEGNRVSYRHLRAVDGLEYDAVFTVLPDRLLLELTQRCDADLPVLEAEGWRIGFDLKASMTGCATLPSLAPGRNGDVALPAVWAGAGVGGLHWRLLEGDPDAVRLQVESYRTLGTVTGGLVLADHPDAAHSLLLPAGKRTATVELAVTPLESNSVADVSAQHEGVRRHFASVLSLFRTEYRGFSNNTASVNVHSSQQVAAELAPYLGPVAGTDPLALSRYTVERALLDGGGYGYFRELYLDCDPILLSAAGRLHQAQPDIDWLRRVAPGLRAALTRMEGEIDDSGLLVCRTLSGNSGSFRWSANAMDVIGFGHIDAYVNAWGYRGLRNAAAIFAELGDPETAERCHVRAAALRAAYAPALLNPETGWVAGWRSRDGQLHDYAFLFVNGPALAFGLLDEPQARTAVANLEALRQRVGLGSARIGLPSSLLPLADDDHLLPKLGLPAPTFETYTDGALMALPAAYYLRALALYGSPGAARQMADELAEGYAVGLHTGGMGSGYEFRSWEGLPCGYEGTLIYSFGPLYGIAIEQGLIQPPSPEWWPTGG